LYAASTRYAGVFPSSGAVPDSFQIFCSTGSAWRPNDARALAKASKDEGSFSSRGSAVASRNNSLSASGDPNCASARKPATRVSLAAAPWIAWPTLRSTWTADGWRIQSMACDRRVAGDNVR
jgi:hypothetical protein